jgi:AAA+ ATPase superfamily predicted ATPase
MTANQIKAVCNAEPTLFEDRLFQEITVSWNIENLYTDLAQAKQINIARKSKLSPVEKAILRGLLSNYPPHKIAAELNWTPRSLSVELTKGLYRYVETLTDRDPNTLKNWRDIAKWLEEAGYKNLKAIQDCVEVPDVSGFYGREKELKQLEEWIIRDKYRLVILLGAAGIGKTSLATKLTSNFKNEFDYVIWRNLNDTPQLSTFLISLIKLFATRTNQLTNLPTTIYEQIFLLISYLRSSRCLIIIDNLEAILSTNNLAGFYQKKYSNYSQFFKKISESFHQSCLILTSRDELADTLLLKSKKVDVLKLGDLGTAAAIEILEEQGLSNSQHCQLLIERYGSNPLVLKLVCATIKDLFSSNICSFFDSNTELGIIVPKLITELLNKQFNNLLELEKKIMYIFVIISQPVTLEQLHVHIQPKVYISELIQALNSLKRRSLLEIISVVNQTSFTLQPILMKYILREHKEELNKFINLIKYTKQISLDS